MNLLQAAFQIEQTKENNKGIYDWRPKEADNRPIEFKSFNIPNSRQKVKIREYLAKTLAFIDYKKYTTFNDKLTIIYISRKNKVLKQICGSEESVRLLIKFMINIGLIALYDNEYFFTVTKKHKNKCKEYAYNKEISNKIIEYCRINKINKIEYNNYKINNSNNKITNKLRLNTFDSKSVKFNSKLHLLKPDNWSVAEFEKYLTECLYNNYPQLKDYQIKADIINQNLDIERKNLIIPKFTWFKGNKAIKKIGIRNTNSLVSCKKERENEDPEWLRYRDDILKKRSCDKDEYDVKSSVPRITYLLNTGKWLDNDIDLYKKIYEVFIDKLPEQKLNWQDNGRNVFKFFFMRAYFDHETMIAPHIKYELSKKIKYYRDDWKKLDNIMITYKRSIQAVLGNTDYDSEIFLHESCIYLDVLEKLLKIDPNVVQVYDGFFFSKIISKEEISKIIKECSILYYNKYIKNNNNKILIINNNNNKNKIKYYNNRIIGSKLRLDKKFINNSIKDSLLLNNFIHIINNKLLFYNRTGYS